MKVSADHVCTEYACKDRNVKIGQDGNTGLYYVSIDGYGCSKMYRTPRDAVYAMLAEHACTNVRITE